MALKITSGPHSGVVGDQPARGQALQQREQRSPAGIFRRRHMLKVNAESGPMGLSASETGFVSFDRRIELSSRTHCQKSVALMERFGGWGGVWVWHTAKKRAAQFMRSV